MLFADKPAPTVSVRFQGHRYAHCPLSPDPCPGCRATHGRPRQRCQRLRRRAANPTQQAKLLESWAAQPDPARIELIDSLQQGQISVDGAPAQPVRLNNRLRGLIDNAVAAQQLLAADAKVRLAAAVQLQKSAKPAQLPFLDRQLAGETHADVHAALSLALANLQLVDPDPAVRLAAVRLLGESGVEPDANVHTAAETSLAQVKRKLMVGEMLGQAFSGMSLGSILLLAALGLAITFGLLGVINMAHGEMLMLGAYATYGVQLLFQRFMPQAIDYYPLVALPVAFFVTAAIGMALERTVIRHLYGRPLETLLATWGISLMLIQLVRLLFGAQNVEVANPAWLSGGIQVLPNLVLPYSRLVIIAFALFVVALTWLLLNKTRLGLNVRAVTQNRNMAACCGVPTGRVDMLAFRHARLRPRLGDRRARRRGPEPDRQRRPGPRPELHHRLVPGGGTRRRRPVGRQRHGRVRPGDRQQDSRFSNHRSAQCWARS